MTVTDKTMWEERGDASTKAMLLLLNSQNNKTKKDLRLSYSQGNKSAGLLTAKAMATYMSTQYPNMNPGYQRNGKRGIRTKKGDDPKSEDKDNNTTGTASVHVEDVTTPEDSIAPSGRSSIGAHIWEVAKHKSPPTRSVEDLLGAHCIDDAIWGHTDPNDVSIDTAKNSA